MPDVGPMQQVHEGEAAQLVLLKAELNAGHKIALLKGGYSPPPGAVYADFLAAKADFHGYADVTLAIAASVSVDADGLPRLVVDRATFTNDDGSSGNSISGWFVFDNVAVPKVVKYYALLNDAVIVALAGQSVFLDLLLRMSGLGTWEFSS